MGAIASAIFRIRVRNMSVLIIVPVSMCHSGIRRFSMGGLKIGVLLYSSGAVRSFVVVFVS